jgi:rfaE bifunctional protein kinase chain/domain
MTVEQMLAIFPARRALVVGDICLDRWCTYDPAEAEPSRETGIPRLAVISSELTPGAGGTIANNLKALEVGGVSVLGVVGEDGAGWDLRQALKARNISHELCVSDAGVATFTYTKLINKTTGREDQPRVDFVNTQPLPESAEQRVIRNLKNAAPNFDIILVSDQSETEMGGVITPAVRDVITAIAKRHQEKVVWVDSRRRPEHFRHVIVKPNEDEAVAACKRAFGEVDFDRLWQHIGGPWMVVTHGARGALVVGRRKTWLPPPKAIEQPVDICGAGDSFSAGAAVAYSITGDIETASSFGNAVASVTIMKRGTGTASQAEVIRAYRS